MAQDGKMAQGSFDYIDDLKRRLDADEISWEDVLKHLHASKPWRKADWKRRRENLIGTACGACGSVEGPMVLQHVWHPAPFSECCNVVRAELLSAYLVLHPYPTDPEPFDAASAPAQPFELRGACPKCGSVNIKQNKAGQWSCKFKVNRRGACRHFFDTPTQIEYRKFSDAHWLSHLESQHRWKGTESQRLWKETFFSEHADAIRKGGAMISLEEHRRYVSLQPEDVVTRCKKCAFKEDVAFRTHYTMGVHVERARAAGQKEG